MSQKGTEMIKLATVQESSRILVQEASCVDAWSSPELSQQEQFDDRQKYPLKWIKKVHRDLKFVREFPSCLQQVCLLDKNEYYSAFENLKEAQVILDIKKFYSIFDELESPIKTMNVNKWHKSALIWLLGSASVENIRPLKERLAGRRFEVLTYSHHSAAYLLVAPEIDKDAPEKLPEGTRRFVEKLLAPYSFHSDSTQMSAPNGSYGIKFKYGEDPKYISSARESHFAVIFDDKFEEKKLQSHFVDIFDDKFEEEKLQSPEEFYENRLGFPIRSNRLLNDPEKCWMEKQCERFDLRQRSVRLLEFNSSQDRNGAMEKKRVEYLDVLFCDTMLSYNEPYEQVHLVINYEMVPKDLDCVAVTLVNESHKKFAESAFSSHRLSSHYYDDDNKHDLKLRYDPFCKKIVVKGFPRHLNTFESRQWFIKRIAKRNEFAISKIEPFVEMQDTKVFKNKKKRTILSEVETELARIGKNYRIQKETDHFIVYFEKVEDGIDYFNHVSDHDGIKITPCFRISFPISRSLRVANDEEIQVLDTDLRKKFSTLSKDEDERMQSHEASYYGARIYENWTEGSDIGMIGLEGWKPDYLRRFSTRLNEILTPKKLDASEYPELMHGIGESYAKDLEKKYDHEVIVDVDKYSKTVFVGGKRADQAIADLRTYRTRKASINVTAALPVFFPHLNERIFKFLTPQRINGIRDSLCLGKLEFFTYKMERYLDFSGTIQSYEYLMNELSRCSDDVCFYELKKCGKPLVQKLFCNICHDGTGSLNGFYRFNCGHTVCRPCLHHMVSTKIADKEFRMYCHAEGCNESLSPTEILNIICGGDKRIRDLDMLKLADFFHHAKDRVINTNVNLKSCAGVDCSGILSKSKGSIEVPKVCDVCSVQYCRKCLENVHPGTTCAENARLVVPEASIAEYMQRAGPEFVQKCPKCQAVVEKVEGCNHMECRCGTHFCWVCLYIATGSGDCYRHMQEQHGGFGINDEMPVEDMDVQIQLALQEDLRNDQDRL